MVEQQFDTPHPVRLEIKVPTADLDIRAVEGQESTVTLDGPDRLVEATRVELVGDRLLIEQERKSILDWLGRLNGTMHVTVSVPHHAAVTIVSSSGDVRLDGAFDQLSMTTASGAVHTSGEIEGDATVKNVSGDVELDRVGGDLRVQTVSGDVEARSVDGSLSVGAVSGNTRIGALRQGRATIHCVSGDITIGVAPGTNVEIDATSASGELTSELELSRTPPVEDGPSLVLRGTTVSGNVRVFRAVAA